MSLDLLYFTGGPRERVLQAVLAAGHRITHLYANDPDRWPKVRPSLLLADAAGIPISIVRSKRELARLDTAVRDQWCLSVGFAYLFDAPLLASARAVLNVHGSLLPKYRGARTLSWAIEKGESESGVTIHLVDEGMDTGPILLQEAFPLSPFETTRSLARKTGAIEPQVVVRALDLLEQQGLAAARAQVASDEASWPNRVPEHSRLDYTLPLASLINKIRAADAEHYPAYFFHKGEKVCVKLWRPQKPDDESDLV